jgi:glycerol uptake facilitator-like aquaporin
MTSQPDDRLTPPPEPDRPEMVRHAQVALRSMGQPNMGTVSGAHLNPAVSVAFAARGDFPWKRVPAYIGAQFVGAALATLVLWAFLGKQAVRG